MARVCHVSGNSLPKPRLLLEAFHGREAKLGPQHSHTIDSLKQLVNLYESWGKPDEAEKWRAKLLRDRDAKE